MINDSVLKVSPKGSFKVTQLCENVAICEATKEDRHNWGNATDSEPAFLVYLGCSEAEISGYLKTINTFYRCEWCEVRKPKYLTKGAEFPILLKVGMDSPSLQFRRQNFIYHGLSFVV